MKFINILSRRFTLRPLLFAAYICGLVCLVAPSTALAHEGIAGHQHTGAAKPQAGGEAAENRLIASGTVFDDLDGDGVQSSNELGVKGVRVSNGREIVRTDELGRYQLPISNDSVVFVIKPRGFGLPLNADNLPQFYYLHKPEGSPKSRFAGVAPTGPLPESVDFGLLRQSEPDRFRALMFGDPQPRNIEEVEYIAHDVVEQIVASDAHSASFGVTLGDIVFDDLAMMKPLNEAIALIGIPWYNVIGNHDMNTDAPSDELSDETFERLYGPSYYSFDYGPTHFLVLDDVNWIGGQNGERGRYEGGLGERQMQFIRNDLNLIPASQLVVLLMHIPLGDVADRRELYRLIEERPAAVSISAHTHYMEHRYIGAEDGWNGKEKHHHIVNVTVCGSWWSGQKDERGIPHATMSDGGPNGYSIMQFDGATYDLEFVSAGRFSDYQMNIYAPESVKQSETAATEVKVNVFAASELDHVEMKVGEGDWTSMQQRTETDPNYTAIRERETNLQNGSFRELTRPHATPHIFVGQLPAILPLGTHAIMIRWTNSRGAETINRRIIRIE